MKKIRIESIGVSNPGKSFFYQGSLSHAVKAGLNCLKQSHLAPMDVEVLINSGIYRDGHYAEPAFSTFIQKKLGINVEFQGRRTLSFDLQNGGCGMLNAIHIISNLIYSGRIHSGMAISSEANADKNPDPGYHYKNSGAAVLLDHSPTSKIGFGNFVFKSFEKYLHYYKSFVNLSVKYGHLFIKKKNELEEAYISCIPEVIEQLLEMDKISLDEVAYIIPSQVSDSFINKLSEKFSGSTDRIINLTHKFADTLSTSVFLTLSYLLDKQKILPGQKIILLTVGSGITVGAATYQF